MIGDTIRRIRLEQGITLRQLAEMTGVSDSYISLLERNVEEPSIPFLRKLAQELNRPIAAFFEEDFPEPEITQASQRKVYALGDGVAFWERLTGAGRDSSSAAMLLLTLLPGTALRCDGTKQQACVCLESGCVQLNFSDASYTMHPGDSMFLQPGVPFAAVCLPGADARGIISLSGNQLPAVTVERRQP